MSPTDRPAPLYERWSSALKDQPIVAVVIILTALAAGIATWADAFKKVRDAVGPGSPAQGASAPIYSSHVNPTIAVSPPAATQAPTSPAVVRQEASVASSTNRPEHRDSASSVVTDRPSHSSGIADSAPTLPGLKLQPYVISRPIAGVPESGSYLVEDSVRISEGNSELDVSLLFNAGSGNKKLYTVIRVSRMRRSFVGALSSALIYSSSVSINGVVLDLRQVDDDDIYAASELFGAFMPKDAIFATVERNTPRSQNDFSAKLVLPIGPPVFEGAPAHIKTTPLVVLVGVDSSPMAELVAASFYAHYRATIMGLPPQPTCERLRKSLTQVLNDARGAAVVLGPSGENVWRHGFAPSIPVSQPSSKPPRFADEVDGPISYSIRQALHKLEGSPVEAFAPAFPTRSCGI